MWRQQRLVAAAIFVALAAAGVAWHAWPAPALVWLDNGSDDELVVARDGEPIARVAARSFKSVTLPSGAHRLDARVVEPERAPDGARIVDEQRLEAHRGQRWVWNIAGKQRYAIYTMTYGQDHPGDAPRPVATGERLFPMPPDVAPQFMQPLPSTLTVAHGTKEATARALYHFPLHVDRACCHTK